MRYHRNFLKLVGSGSGSVKILRKGSASGSVRFSRIRALEKRVYSQYILPCQNFVQSTSSEGVAAFVKGYNQGCADPGKSYGSGSGYLLKKSYGSDQFPKNVMGSHKIHTFSRTDIAIASILLYFGNLLGYKVKSYKKPKN